MAAESPAAQHLAWETPVARIGREGLQLNKSLDDLTMQEVSRLSNLFHSNGDLYTRLGQTGLATLSGTVHSVRRLNIPKTGTFTRFWGAGTNWYRGASGALGGALAGGFSGNPLTFLTVRPPFSGESWMVAADSSQMQKASATSPSLPLGLPVPTGLTTAVAASISTAIAAFNTSDSTQAAKWHGFDGVGNGPFAIPRPPGFTGNLSPPTLSDVTGVNGNGVQITYNPGTSTGGFCEGMGIALPLNLALLPGGVLATDDDLIHLSMRIVDPNNVITEIRIYFVCSAFTAPGPGVTWCLPGIGLPYNVSAYMRAFRPSDYTTALLNQETVQSAADRVRTAAFLEGFSNPPLATNPIGKHQDPTVESPASPGVWATFGGLDFPVRRGDFTAIGSAGLGPAGTTDWSTVTGIFVVVATNAASGPQVALNDCYLTGGYGPDTSEPGTQPYDYRVINYDPRTGCRSNPTPIQTGALGAVDANGVILTAPNNVPDLTLGGPTTPVLRQQITVTPAVYLPDPAILQEAYRRGGTLVDNWYFAGRNTTNGGVISDAFADTDLTNADTVPLDHFQPVATTDANGNTVLAQPLPIVFGPFDDGTVCGLGDPYQPGFLYACIAGEIDHWPSTGGYAIEVCAPAEELMNGCLLGGQGFVLSRERGYTVYTNLSGGTGIVATPSGCKPGLAARWGFCLGHGVVYYVSRDSVRVTNGGDSTILSDQIRPLFHNQSVNGYAPIDFSVPTAIRLAVFDTDLYFLFQDTNGARQCFVYSLLYRYWRPYAFARALAVVYQDETQSEQDAQGDLLAILGSTNGSAYTHSGFTDDGVAIPFEVRTGAWNWNQPRIEKLLGDLVVEADLEGVTLTVQTFLNTESVTNAAQTVAGAIGRTRYLFEPFGTTPQHARNVSIDLSGTAPTGAQAFLSFVGLANVPQPEVTLDRATTWETLGQTESFLYAVVIDCDTGGSDRTILVEYDDVGVIKVAATLTVNAAGRHKLWFSWPVVYAQLVRLRPTGTCVPWMLFNVEWVGQAEPPRIAGWDSNFETLGDTYYTGLDLEIDTFGQDKTLEIYADGTLIQVETVNRPQRMYWHVTLPPGRAHVYRFLAVDDNPGHLYSHKWLTDPEPGEQTHWNAPYTVWNSLSDKYLKGIVIEADTFGQAKSVNVEVDGVVRQVIAPVTHSGRSVQNYTFPQVLGRVFRIIPTDGFPSRLYTAQPLFDEEPFALARWETQLLDFDLPGSGWGSVLSSDVCYRSTAPATIQIDCYNSQGTLLTSVSSPLASTGGTKQKVYVPFAANKGVLFKTVLTTADGSPTFTWYREESRLRIKPWSGMTSMHKPFGDDDLDPSRDMVKAAVSAGRSGGAAR